MKYLATLALLFAALFLLSCGLLPDNAPKLIDADGSAYVACEGLVWVTTQEGGIGGASYSVRFREKGGTARDLRGIKKLDISDPPKGFYPCKSEEGKNVEKGTPDCRNGYVLYSDVKSYAIEHNESLADVGDRVKGHGCKIVDTLPQQ